MAVREPVNYNTVLDETLNNISSNSSMRVPITSVVDTDASIPTNLTAKIPPGTKMEGSFLYNQSMDTLYIRSKNSGVPVWRPLTTSGATVNPIVNVNNTTFVDEQFGTVTGSTNNMALPYSTIAGGLSTFMTNISVQPGATYTIPLVDVGNVFLLLKRGSILRIVSTADHDMTGTSITVIGEKGSVLIMEGDFSISNLQLTLQGLSSVLLENSYTTGCQIILTDIDYVRATTTKGGDGATFGALTNYNNASTDVSFSATRVNRIDLGDAMTNVYFGYATTDGAAPTGTYSVVMEDTDVKSYLGAFIIFYTDLCQGTSLYRFKNCYINAEIGVFGSLIGGVKPGFVANGIMGTTILFTAENCIFKSETDIAMLGDVNLIVPNRPIYLKDCLVLGTSVLGEIITGVPAIGPTIMIMNISNVRTQTRTDPAGITIQGDTDFVLDPDFNYPSLV